MNLDAFIHHLHYDTDQARPPDWEVDWEDAPLPYKLYRGLPAVCLSPEVPLTLEVKQKNVKPALREIGHFLWYVFGLTQVCQSILPLDSTQQMSSMPYKRRYIPSGGGLYPNELYVYLKLEELPAGVYHYDAAHHRLVLLREGEFDSYLDRALGGRCDVPACFGAVFVTTVFWKNFFKYHNFGYRLQGLDAGVLIGQLLEAAKRFGISTGVYFQFLDRALNHLLGLTQQEESVIAAIPLSSFPEMAWFENRKNGIVSAVELCRELPVVSHRHVVRSRRVREYPLLIRMNEASLLESSLSFRRIAGKKKAADAGPIRGVILSSANRLSYDLAAVSRKRYSPEMDFVKGMVRESVLAALLQEAAESFLYRNDLDEDDKKSEPRVCLYCCLSGAEGIPDGAYRYDSAQHVLRQVRPGDHRLRLQQGMSLDNVNLYQVPLCLHVAGDRDHLRTVLGYRGYRIQQMEAGMLVQRLLLAAFALGMGGHPLLGYDAGLCDGIYRLAGYGQTSLIQVPVGPYRDRPRLSGGLHG